MLHNSSFKVKIKNTLTGPLKQNIRWAPNSKSTFEEKKEEKISGGRKWQKGKIHNKNKKENYVVNSMNKCSKTISAICPLRVVLNLSLPFASLFSHKRVEGG